MRKAKEIVGLSVISFNGGSKLATVLDILFDPQENQVLALVVDWGGWFSAARVIPFDRIESIGRDAVVVSDRSAIIAANSQHADSRIRQALKSDRVVSRLRVFSNDGRNLGKVGDMLVDEATGVVTAYEVTGGLMSETLRGKHTLPAPEAMHVGRQVMFVPKETGDRLEQEVPGGLQRAAMDTSAGISEATERVRVSGSEALDTARVRSEEALRRAGERGAETLSTARIRGEEALTDARERGAETLGTARTRAEEALTDAREQIGRTTTEQQKRYVVGRRAERTVTTPDGRVVVAEGQLITESVADLAESDGVLSDLVAAAGTAHVRDTVTVLRTGASDTMSTLLTNASDTMNTIGSNAPGVFEEVRSALSEMTDKARKRDEENRIKGALGLPVTRVILDQDDEVILNTGELVTHRAVAWARTAGVLDVLLSSVSRKTPEFGIHQRMAPRPGEASLQEQAQDPDQSPQI